MEAGGWVSQYEKSFFQMKFDLVPDNWAAGWSGGKSQDGKMKKEEEEMSSAGAAGS